MLDNQIRNLRVVFGLGGLATLRITAADVERTWSVGRDEPVAVLTGSAIDLLRSIGGRRTIEQISELGWTGRSAGLAEHLVLPFFSAPPEPIPGG